MLYVNAVLTLYWEAPKPGMTTPSSDSLTFPSHREPLSRPPRTSYHFNASCTNLPTSFLSTRAAPCPNLSKTPFIAGPIAPFPARISGDNALTTSPTITLRDSRVGDAGRKEESREISVLRVEYWSGDGEGDDGA